MLTHCSMHKKSEFIENLKFKNLKTLKHLKTDDRVLRETDNNVNSF